MKRETTILLAHGSGGRLSRELVETEILTRFGESSLAALPDAASIPRPPRPLLFSTDSFVVRPLFFPGGNIGDLAVYGTVNDLAVSGATPRWLSLALILEEGLEMNVLRQVLDAVKNAAVRCDVTVVTGDTKVVHRGQCDGMYITTSGIGELLPGFELDQRRIMPGDLVLTSGTLGDHGMAVMAVREGIDFRDGPVSDTAPVHRLVQGLRELAPAIKFMRDPTRGGAAAVLNEMLGAGRVDIVLGETELPFAASTKALAEILGFDLLHSASEGRLLAVCAADAAPAVLDYWKSLPEGKGAAAIGRVTTGHGRVMLETLIGGRRLVSLPEGELLPRIC